MIVANLTSGPGHVSRTVAFGGSNGMYVSIGSSCNVCEESDQRRATIKEFSPDGTGERMFAQGLRNSVGFVFHPVTGKIWATENGCDGLGDDVPPDEVNIFARDRITAGRSPSGIRSRTPPSTMRPYAPQRRRAPTISRLILRRWDYGSSTVRCFRRRGTATF